MNMNRVALYTTIILASGAAIAGTSAFAAAAVVSKVAYGILSAAFATEAGASFIAWLNTDSDNVKQYFAKFASYSHYAFSSTVGALAALVVTAVFQGVAMGLTTGASKTLADGIIKKLF